MSGLRCSYVLLFGISVLASGCVSVPPPTRAPVETRNDQAVPAPTPPPVHIPRPVHPRPASAAPNASSTPSGSTNPVEGPGPEPVAPPPPPPNAPVGPVLRGAATLAGMSAASQALLVQSHHQVAAGNLGAAADDLERALRIDPSQPVLWLELGEVRLKAGARAQAEMLAQRAQSLGGKDPAIQSRVEDLLERAAQ